MPTFDPSGLSLPDFYVIGPHKSGTTELNRMLHSHVSIDLYRPAGGGFGRLNWLSRQNKWRQGLEPYAENFKWADSIGRLVGDESPEYFGLPEALLRMDQITPSAKVVVMLRDPTKLWLDLYARDGGNQTQQGFWDLQQAALDQGLYEPILRRLFELFPTEQVRIEYLEKMRADTENVVGGIITWLGKSKDLDWDVETIPADDDTYDEPYWRDKLNTFFTTPVDHLKTYLTGLGYSVTPINDYWLTDYPSRPDAVDDSYTMDQDATLSPSAEAGVLANDTDPDGDPLTVNTDVSPIVGPSHGSLTLNEDGSFVYVPTESWNGTDTFSYKCNDGTKDSFPATVTITVSAP